MAFIFFWKEDLVQKTFSTTWAEESRGGGLCNCFQSLLGRGDTEEGKSFSPHLPVPAHGAWGGVLCPPGDLLNVLIMKRVVHLIGQSLKIIRPHSQGAGLQMGLSPAVPPVPQWVISLWSRPAGAGRAPFSLSLWDASPHRIQDSDSR